LSGQPLHIWFFKIVGFDKGLEVPLIEGKSLTEATEELNRRKMVFERSG